MERNLVLEPHTVAQLAEIVTEVSHRLKTLPNAKPDKDFLAAQVIRLYGLGIKDPKALRQKLWRAPRAPTRPAPKPCTAQRMPSWSLRETYIGSGS